MKLFYIISIFSILAINEVKCTCNTTARTTMLRLQDHLLEDYDIEEGPVDRKNKINITILVIIKSIKPIKEERKLRKIDINCQVGVFWKDKCLQWNPKDYDGIDTLHLKSNKFWVPDMETLQNGVSKKIFDTAKCLVRPKGTVACSVGITGQTDCKRINTNYWPWDKIECELEFESIKYGNKSVKIRMHKIPIYYFKKTSNEMYRMYEMKASTNEKLDKDETFTMFKYTFTFLRNGANKLALTKFTPTVVLAITNLAIVALPPMGKERLTLCYTSIVTHLMNAFDQYYSLPFPENPPFISRINLVSFLLSVTILIITILLRSMLNSIKIMPPLWLIGITRFIYNTFGKYLLFNKNMDFEGYTNLKDVAKEECVDRLIIYQVIDRIYFLVSYTIYFILFIILLCMFFSA